MKKQPEFKRLTKFGTRKSVADVSLLKYKGYIEYSVKTPSSDLELR